ncbi:MAG TPA: DUF2231 domain-containing protein [Aquifex aeolicus]|nr:DUF2231 domain-containing protein [Aquifex aeolicus]
MKGFIITLCAPLLFSLFSFSYAHEREAVQGAPQQAERITYPEVVKIHPPAVHFAIALPVFALLVGAMYHLRGREPDEVELMTLLLASGAVVAASITGYVAHESMEHLPITEEALGVLHTHETLGIGIAVLFSIIAVLRIAYMLKASKVIHRLYMLLLLVGVVLLFLQGNHGGRLVYEFGLGVSR